MVDPTNHGWFSEIFFRLTKKHIPYPPENCCLEEAIFPLQFGKWCLLAGASFIFLGGYLDRPDFLEPRLIARPKRSLGKAKADPESQSEEKLRLWIDATTVEFSIHDFCFCSCLRKQIQKKAGKQKKHGWNFSAMGKKCSTLIWWVCGIPPNKWGLMNNSYLHLKFYFFRPWKVTETQFRKSGGKLVFRPSAFPWVNIAVKLWGCMGFSVWGWSTMNVSEWL